VFSESVRVSTLSNAEILNCHFLETFICTMWQGSTFKGTQFAGRVTVQSVVAAQIIDCEFGGDFFASEAVFYEKPSVFDRVTFRGAVVFNHASFVTAPSFILVKFADNCGVNSVTIDSPLSFVEVDFGAYTTFAATDMSRVTFRRCKMSGVALAEARDVAAADFDANDWQGNGRGPVTLHEEKSARRTRNRTEYLAAERAFREVRRSLEDRRHFTEAGRFASREIDMRRLALSAAEVRPHWMGLLRTWLVSPEALYLHSSLYGDSITRPALVLLGLLALSPFALAVSGINLGEGVYACGQAAPLVAAQSYMALLAYSLRTAALIPDPIAVKLEPGAQIYVVFLRLAGPCFALLISLAVRRRFRR
jgi:hypothetical protein